jgi:hypothetical protein
MLCCTLGPLFPIIPCCLWLYCVDNIWPHTPTSVACGLQVIGAVVDVEFDEVEDVPDILNALKIKLHVEKYNKANDQRRTVALLPKQVRHCCVSWLARNDSFLAADPRG